MQYGDLSELIEKNHHQVFQLFSLMPGSRVLIEPDNIRFFTGSEMPAMNGILWSAVNPETQSERMLELLNEYRNAKIPALWKVGGLSGHATESSRFLYEAQCQLVTDDPEMVLDLQQFVTKLPTETAKEERVIFSVAEKTTQIDDWLSIFAQSFSLTNARDLAFYREFLLRSRVNPGAPFDHIVGYLDKRPVASASLFIHQGLPVLYNVSTAPLYRRRGLASYLIADCAYKLFDRGFAYLALFSNDVGYPLYKKLGFKPVGRMQAFLI